MVGMKDREVEDPQEVDREVEDPVVEELSTMSTRMAMTTLRR